MAMVSRIVWEELSALRNFADRCTRLFVMDGVISLPVAFAGFFFIPDLPEMTRVWYLNKTVRPLST